MRLRSVHIQNYRALSHVSLRCASRLNVFVGGNGAGKTTLLRAVAALLAHCTARLRGPGSVAGTKPLREEDIRAGTMTAELTAEADLDARPVTWSVRKGRPGGKIPAAGSFEQLNEAIRTWRQSTPDDTLPPLPAIVYYATTRAVLDIPLKIRKKHTFSPLDAYEGAYEGNSGFRTFFEWFRNREDLENERLRDGLLAAGDPQLSAVKQAMSVFLPGLDNWRIRRLPLRMTVDKHGQTISVSELSDGEKCLLAMIGDMARRMAIAAPNLSDPLQAEGIILIDEAELHLHPAWQKELLPGLLRTFPNVQFFVTTHSPLILAQLNTELLRDAKAGIPAGRIAVHTLRDGQPVSLIDSDTGLIGAGEMDEAAEAVDQAFETLLNG